jgi:hypothetical protein
MSEAPAGEKRCVTCSRVIEVCVCCYEPGCSAPVCYRCLNVTLRQTRPQPYVWADSDA